MLILRTRPDYSESPDYSVKPPGPHHESSAERDCQMLSRLQREVQTTERGVFRLRILPNQMRTSKGVHVEGVSPRGDGGTGHA